MDKLKMKTSDLTDENIGKIAELFPNVITEKEGKNGKIVKAIDFDLLRQELSKDLVEDDNERYRLDWPGKKASLLKANTPIDKTLRPNRESSVDFDKTENVYIEGDNFEVLKVLQESYLNKIKMIYIDPPYNTGKDFVYRDNTTQSREEYEEELGVEDEEGGKLFRNTDTNGRFHSDWLSMMYERLVVARDLLKDDGVIFMSIDDNEVANLRKIGDEIFGEENLIAQLPRSTTNKGKNDEQKIATSHDYVLMYGKIKRLSRNKDFSSLNRYKLKDDRGKYYAEATLDSVSLPYSKSLDFEIQINGKKIKPIVYNGKKTCWRWSKDLVEFGKKNNLIVEKKGRLYTKTYLNYEISKNNGNYKLVEKEVGGTFRSQLLMDYKFSNNEASRALKDLKLPFSYSKPITLVQQLIKLLPESDDSIILDFFSGSATTAHAVMQLNAEDGGNRKFIMAQLPEKTDEKSEAFKAGYKTISEIGMERIRRAGKKILEDNAEKLKERETPLDIGFRVYKTDSTNMKDVYYNPAELKQSSLLDMVDNIKDDRTPEDLLTQVMLDLGLTLDLPIETKRIKSNTVFFVADNSLVACFDKNIDFEIVDEIAKVKPLKVVFRDACFKDDKDRINVEERFKRLSPETSIKVI
jgi:adenine-specific DNA-methyltransferase